MRKEDAWEKTVRSGLSFSDILGEMGYKKEDGDFMVIKMDRNYPALEVETSGPNNKIGGYELKEYPLHPYAKTYEDACKTVMRSDQEYYDSLCVHPDNGGKISTGVTGSNNGVYAAYSRGSKEMIVTRNPEIIRQLETQLCFENRDIGVPFSNGDHPKNLQKNIEWQYVARRSNDCTKLPKRIMTAEEKAEAKKREEFMKSLQPDKSKTESSSSNPLRDAALARKTRGY